ncbi:hypothetical protein EV424DRAFT_1352084 [Suillus variegatus]|nr:hypothetical protein EV424DRAFT_1352084 [Suillus variegatus]
MLTKYQSRGLGRQLWLFNILGQAKAMSYIRLVKLLLRNGGLIFRKIGHDLVFSDNTIHKCFLCYKYIVSGPCEVHDEVCFKVVNIIDVSTTSYKSAIPPLPGSPRVQLDCLLLEYRGHICDADDELLTLNSESHTHINTMSSLQLLECPSCGKGSFKDHVAVTRHMSQPCSGCNTWLQNLICLDELNNPVNMDESDDRVNNSDMESSGFENWDEVFQGSRMEDQVHDERTPTRDSEVMDSYPDCAQSYGRGYMFLDLFNTDENSKHRVMNPYYAFSGQRDWEVGS